MQDVLWLGVTVTFFVLSIAYVRFCERLNEDKDMTLESTIMLVVSALTGVYLVYALLRPEKF
jgi:K+-transporting ATPase KdpF subunit